MPNRRTRFVWLAVAALALTAACESQTPQSPTSTSSVAPSPEAPTATNSGTPGVTDPGTPGVSDEAAQNLCSSIQAELSNWRVQGPTLGKPGLNIVVQTWAAQNGSVNIEVLRNRGLVDTITIAHCPDVRQQALEALEIPDLASGLVGI